MENTKRSAKARRLQELEALLDATKNHEQLRKAFCIVCGFGFVDFDIPNSHVRKMILAGAKQLGDATVKELIELLKKEPEVQETKKSGGRVILANFNAVEDPTKVIGQL